MKAAIYARVSTDRQDSGLQVQVEALYRFCKDRGWEVLAFDDQVSGTVRDRPGLEAMLKAVERHSVRAVVVQRLDRMARSLQHLLEISETLQRHHCDLVVTDQAIDTTTAAGRFTFQILGAVAELERELIRERVIAGVRRAQAKGTKSGRAIGRPKKYHVDPATVSELRAEGRTVKSIARILNVPEISIYRAIGERG